MKYFTIAELTKSATAKAKHIDNTPSEAVEAHLTELVDELLDPLREAWGSGIKITSGYRCKALNTAIGGAKASAHMSGYAADTKPSNGKMAEYQRFVRAWLKDKKYDQYIVEYPDRLGVASWIHIGLKNMQGKQRKQNLTIR